VLPVALDPPAAAMLGLALAEGRGGPAGAEATDELLFLLRPQLHLPPGPLWQPTNSARLANKNIPRTKFNRMAQRPFDWVTEWAPGQ
jgi:hypothetical protein